MAKTKKVEDAVEEGAPVGESGFPESVSPVKGPFGVTVFQVITSGDKARVYGKNGLPVSPVVSVGEASKFAARSNALDAEQIEAKNRPQGVRKNALAEEANKQ